MGLANLAYRVFEDAKEDGDEVDRESEQRQHVVDFDVEERYLSDVAEGGLERGLAVI